MKRHYREDNNYNPNKNVKHEEVTKVCAIRSFLWVTLSTGKVGCRTEPLLNILGNKVWIFLCKN